MIRFLADECIFDVTLEFLRNEGWDIFTVKELGLQGANDSLVLNKAQEMEAVLLTRDMDFGDITRFKPSAHRGVIVLRMTYHKSHEVHAVLQKMLQEVKEDAFAGTLFVIDNSKWRKRTSP
jgi:predicted nuclease of predicted toxin-antitoxin system